MEENHAPPLPAPEPTSAPPARFRHQLTSATLGLLFFVLLIHLLQLFATVLQQLFTAGLIAYLILPLHHWLVRRGVPFLGSCVLIIVGTLCCFATVGFLVTSSLEDMIPKLPQYSQSLIRLLHQTSEMVPGLDPEMLQRILSSETATVVRSVNLLRAALETLFGFFSQALLVVVYLVFLLAEQTTFAQRIEKAFAADSAGHVEEVVAKINASIVQYLAVKTLMSLLGAVITTATLLVFGVDYPFFWGVLAFVLNYIPYLGSLVAVVLPALLCMVQLESLRYSLLVLLLLGLMQNGIGYLVEPRLAGRRLDLSPLVIILSLAFWGSLWGIAGMILAVPLVVVMKIVLENIPATRPIAILMSNV